VLAFLQALARALAWQVLARALQAQALRLV
jgi:hypothetical protein